MIMHPVNLGVPDIWGVAIVPGTTGTEDAAIEKRKALLGKLARAAKRATRCLMVGQERKSKRHQNPGARST
jgi:hypothetical protein